MQLAVAALQSAKHAATAQACHARTSANCEGGDICCSPFISKQLDIEDDEGEQSDMMNKCTLHFFVLYIYIYIYIYIYTHTHTCISKRRAK